MENTTSEMSCFANYFEDLAMPKDNNDDSVFLEMCNVICRKT